MKTLTEAFQAELKIPEKSKTDARVIEVLDHLSKLFQAAIEKPELVGRFYELWKKVMEAPREDGGIVLGPEITSEITLDKITKW